MIAYYLDQLSTRGIHDLPSLDEAMRAYARAAIWGFTIGWLMAGDSNYGLEILQANLDRLVTALEYLDTLRLIDRLPDP